MPLMSHQLNYETDDVPEIQFVYKDIFDMKFLYFMLHEWLVENGWCTRKDQKFREVYYTQRDSAGGKEILIKWRTEKDLYDPAWHMEMDIKMHVLGLKETEIVVKGKKMKVDNGEIEIKIAPRLVFDRKKYFASPFFTLIKDKLFPLVLKKKKEEMYGKLFRESYRLYEAVKHYFKLETYFEIKEGQGEFYEQIPE